ncbi:FAD dependent oxidoreductase [Phaffia rhodozyma]|uniref:FAD dependent oxidoreductase n=1 Tax=Phaffia rhodozyma TaxID=264483 RepID=A0A0F7SUY1_PHARH|nr:FAD dependent oxidoreductase [Phaffia rhodozyma]
MSAFPQKFTSTVSHWQASNRGPNSLYLHGSKDPLPKEEVDFLIIGAGITGASLAYQLTRRGGAGEGKSVVLVEAKDIASGATGRNGGHFSPAVDNAFITLITPLSEGGAGVSEKEAVQILLNEKENYNIATEIIKKERLDVDLWQGEGVEVLNEERLAVREHSYKAWMKARKELGIEGDGGVVFIRDSAKAKEITRCHTAVAAVLKPAGSVHPHKLSTELVRLALESPHSKFSFFSWTPVRKFEARSGQDEEGWDVDCWEKGVIRAKQVVLCSNAHTGQLFDHGSDIDNHITPVRGHCSLITPTINYSGPNSLDYTYGFGGPYMVTTPTEGMVLGVGWLKAQTLTKGGKNDFVAKVDDSVILPEVETFLSNYCKDEFTNWGKEAHGEGLTRIWTGIMGYSRDVLPLVGQIPGKKGLWTAVAFHGHGMSRIISCTQSLAQQIKDQGTWDPRLPRSFEITQERLDRAKAAPKMSDLNWREAAVQSDGAEEGATPVKSELSA